MLDLRGNDFSGGLDGKLGGFSNFKTLELSGNRFDGEIGADVGQLEHLEVLELSDNLLYGKISVEILTLSALRVLRLNDNAVTRFPDATQASASDPSGPPADFRNSGGLAASSAASGPLPALVELDLSQNILG